MAVEVSPGFIQANTYSAEITRRAAFADLSRGATIGSVAGGLVAPTDAQITAGSGLHVEVSPGEVVVPGSSSATQSGYYFRVSSTSTLVIPAANATNPRIERVVAQVKDAAYSGVANEGVLSVLEGTATSGANLTNLTGAAAAPASSLTLGYVLVPALASSLTAEDIKNVSERLVPGLSTATYREGTAAARPAAGVPNRIYRATDSLKVYIDTGSEWKLIPEAGVASSAVERSTVPGNPASGGEIGSTNRGVMIVERYKLRGNASKTAWELAFEGADSHKPYPLILKPESTWFLQLAPTKIEYPSTNVCKLTIEPAIANGAEVEVLLVA